MAELITVDAHIGRPQLDAIIGGTSTNTYSNLREQPTPAGGYFLYKGKLYERSWMPIDKKWTVSDSNGVGVNAQEFPDVYTAAQSAQVYKTKDDIPEVGKAVSTTIAQSSSAPYNMFAQNNLRSLQSRQNWVRDNAEYLKSRGWTPDEILGYQDLNLTNAKRADLNIRLAGQIAEAKNYTQKKQNAEALKKQVTITSKNNTNMPFNEQTYNYTMGLRLGKPAGMPVYNPYSASVQQPAQSQAVATNNNSFVRSKTDVYQDSEGNIDWKRSVKPEAYQQGRINDVRTAYANDMDLLKSTFNGHMNLAQTNAYWAKWRELQKARRAGLQNAKDAGSDYQNAYNDYVYGQIGKTPDAGVGGEAREIPLSNKTVNPYFTYTKGNFKTGGKINYQKIFKSGGAIPAMQRGGE